MLALLGGRWAKATNIRQGNLCFAAFARRSLAGQQPMVVWVELLLLGARVNAMPAVEEALAMKWSSGVRQWLDDVSDSVRAGRGLAWDMACSTRRGWPPGRTVTPASRQGQVWSPWFKTMGAPPLVAQYRSTQSRRAPSTHRDRAQSSPRFATSPRGSSCQKICWRHVGQDKRAQ